MQRIQYDGQNMRKSDRGKDLTFSPLTLRVGIVVPRGQFLVTLVKIAKSGSHCTHYSKTQFHLLRVSRTRKLDVCPPLDSLRDGEHEGGGVAAKVQVRLKNDINYGLGK